MKNNNVPHYDYRILYALRRISRAVGIYSRKLNAEFGLTTPQLICLDVLEKANKMILKDLAKKVNLSESTVNGIVDRLETKNFVIRERSKKDRRKVYLEITASGRKMIKKTPPLLQDKLSVSFAKLSDTEKRNITESLERIVELMHAENLIQA
ncbi:MAG: MarR family transcriptional regulator [Fidelibacterota bacterium]